MPLSGNKGEWSEIYTLFRLLGDGKVHAGDADMNKLSLYYPIINVIREEAQRYEYQPKSEQDIVVINENGQEFARIPMSLFLAQSNYLLNEIKAANQRSFCIPTSEAFMNMVGCHRLKAVSSDKADIHIVIHDLRTNMTPLLGFSIKSQLGSAATLLNPGIPTNITYKVEGNSLSDAEIMTINSIQDHLPRMQAIFSNGRLLKYHNIEHDTFKNNLLFLDGYMPEFIAECLLCGSTQPSLSNVKDIVEKIALNNPFGYSGNNILSFYEHKMKVLLLDVALGLTPASEWDGQYDANGGYLVVRKDGEIVCYHFYNRNDVEDYLYHNTRFDRASRNRYNFGSLFRGEDGEVYIKLNLQIRFKK